MTHGRRRIVATLALAALAAAGARAQAKPARIVVLGRNAAPLQNLRDGLREIGHVEGRTYVFEERYAGGNTERLYETAVEAARTGPDIIYATHGEAAQAAKRATATIPIVFGVLDPVAEGLVTSLARPGGNATGIAIGYELGAKRVEVLRDALPAARRLAVLHSNLRAALAELDAIKAAAARLNFELLPLLALTGPALAPAIEGAARAGADSLMHISSPSYRTQRETIVALAARHRLPAIYDDVETVEAGGLMSYAHDRRLVGRRIAAQMDRILKGAKPADIPVELPTRFELAVNLRTARELGLTLPPALVSLADRVVE
jgi:putative ABC transport system substrate-binding protein